MTHQAPAPLPEDDPDLALHRLLLEAGKALHSTLSEVLALELQPKKWSVLDLDDETYVRTMAEDDRVAYLRLLMSKYHAREGIDGLAQTPTDKLAHAMLSESLTALLKGSLVVGEEATGRQWDAVAVAPAGTLFWILDAIDGSALEDTVGYGFSCNALLYRKGEGAHALPLMSVTVTSSGRMLGWITPNRVGAAQLTFLDPHTGQPTVAELLEPLVLAEEVRSDWIAVVAAQPDDRRRAEPLLREGSRWSVMTLGNAPAFPGLLLGRLAAAVILSPQTRHDAAPLLALAGKGLHFIDALTLKGYSDSDIRGFFTGFARPSTSGYRPIPGPMVIAREPETALELARELQWHSVRLKRDETKESGVW